MSKRPVEDATSGKAAKTAGRYRKVEVRTWGDEKFRSLTPIPPCGQGLWLFLITGPHTGPIPGLFRAGRASMSEELGWDLEAFDEAFAEAFWQGMVKADFKARLVWIPRAISHNKPESPNVVKSWAAEFDLLPECDLKREAFAALKASIHALGEAFAKAFDEAFSMPLPKPLPKPSSKAMPNQEQEQEQEYSEAKASAADAAESPSPLTAKDRVWLLGPPLVGDKGRSALGKLVKTYGEEAVAEVLAKATLERPIEPLAWVTAALQQRSKAKPVNGNHSPQADMLSDPKPAWALRAGFPDRFQAENAGCLPHNATKFRDGRRVAT